MRPTIPLITHLRISAAATLISLNIPSTSEAGTFVSRALSANDLSDSTSNAGALQTAATSGAPEIDGVTTTVVTGVTGGSEPSVMTYRAVGADLDFTYDITVEAYQSEGGVETLVTRRNVSGHVQPSSNLGGQDRQRIDSPDTVGEGNWEFVRLTVGNVQVTSGGPINLLGFSAAQVNSINATGDDGDIEDASNDSVLASWVGDPEGASGTLELSATHPTSIDFVATGNSGGRNANKASGFAVAFETGPGSPFIMTDVTFDGSTATATWNSDPDQPYYVYFSTDLVNWEELDDSFASQGASTTYTDDIASRFAAMDPPQPVPAFGFYRAEENNDG